MLKVLMWRRAAAVALCAFLMAPLCRPLLTGDGESDLPPCCRRDGKHHCAMTARYLALRQRWPSEPRFRSAPEPCPYRWALFAPRAPHPLGSPRSLAFYAAVESHPAILTHVEAFGRVSQSRSHFKRGPPALL